MLLATSVREGPFGPSWEGPGIGHNTASDTEWGGEKENRKGKEEKGKTRKGKERRREKEKEREREGERERERD